MTVRAARKPSGTKSSAALRPARAGAGRRRLDPALRERQIIDEAIRFFSERGLDGSTAELARRLGVTQPLLFRYFPTKDALIQRIYEEMEGELVDPTLIATLEDENKPLRQRLVDFYRSYVRSVMSRDRFRLFLLAGVNGNRTYADRYFELMQRTVYAALIRAIRREGGRAISGPPSELEMEAVVSGLQAMIHYLAIRRWVYGARLHHEVDDVIALIVDLFLDGAVAATAKAQRASLLRPVRRAAA